MSNVDCADKDEAVSSAAGQKTPALFLLVSLTGLYFLSVFVKPGWLTFGLSAFALTVIFITALARVNDIGTHLTGKRWHIRRFGLVLAGMGAAAQVVVGATQHIFPSWYEVTLCMGIAFTWFTTPGMPPWWRFIAGKTEQ